MNLLYLLNSESIINERLHLAQRTELELGSPKRSYYSGCMEEHVSSNGSLPTYWRSVPILGDRCVGLHATPPPVTASPTVPVSYPVRDSIPSPRSGSPASEGLPKPLEARRECAQLGERAVTRGQRRYRVGKPNGGKYLVSAAGESLAINPRRRPGVREPCLRQASPLRQGIS